MFHFTPPRVIDTANVAYGGIAEACSATILHVDAPGRPMCSHA